MACAGFDMAGLFAVRQASAQAKGRNALAGGGNVIIRPFDGFHRHGGDFADVHMFAVDRECVFPDFAFFEHAFDRGQVEFGGHVHNCQIFIVKTVVGVMVRRFALGRALDLIGKRLGVAICVHRHERRQLQQARINLTPNAFVFEANALDHQLF